MRADRGSLMVEGEDDRRILGSLLERSGLSPRDRRFPTLDAYNGVSNLLKSVHTQVKSNPTVGIIVDADQAPNDRWAEIRGCIRRADPGMTLPATLEREGTIFPGVQRGWKIGVWMMPDNVQPGMLEDFVAGLIPAEDRCWPHARSSTTAARCEFGAPLRAVHEAKGAIHAWLAWQDPSGRPLRSFVAEGPPLHEAPLARTFVAWFSRLFELETKGAR